MEDSKIVDLIYSRNEAGIDETSRKYGRLLHSLADKILQNREDSQECVNDTYVNIWDSIPPKRPYYFKSFICKIVRRNALDKYRYNHRENRDFLNTVYFEDFDFDIAVSHSAESVVLSSMVENDINGFLLELPESSRVLFIRRYFMLESNKELSEKFGISENNVSVKLLRIKKNLKKYLEKRGYIID